LIWFLQRLLLDHTVSGSDKASVFYLGPGRNIYSLDLSVSEILGQLAAVHAIGLASLLLVFCREIVRVDYKALYPRLLQAVVNPKATIAGFVNCLSMMLPENCA